jgi:hypothetical protein
MEKKEIKLKIFEADNGIVLVDKSVCAVSVIEREDEGNKEKIYKAIGESIYEEWEQMKEGDKYVQFGVEIKVELKPMKKDVLY